MINDNQSIFNPYIIEVYCINEKNVPYPVETHFEERVVKFYELELITGGNGTIITNGETAKASKGDVFLREPGTIVEGYSGYYFIVIMFDAFYDVSRKGIYASSSPYWVTNEKEMLSNIGFFKDVPYKLTTYNYEIDYLFKSVFNEFIKKQQNCQLILKSHLMNILNLLLVSPENTIKRINTRSFEHNYEIIKCSQNYIDNNLHKDLTLLDLAERCGVSKNFYCKIFKSIIGLSPFDYIIQSRMNTAKRLLTTTNMKISAISIMCGINNITYFHKLFKKHVNMTPANFRERFGFTKAKYKL